MDQRPDILDPSAASWFLARMLNVRTEMIRNRHQDPAAVDDLMVGICTKFLATLGTGFAGGGSEFRTKVIAAFDDECRKAALRGPL